MPTKIELPLGRDESSAMRRHRAKFGHGQVVESSQRLGGTDGRQADVADQEAKTGTAGDG